MIKKQLSELPRVIIFQLVLLASFGCIDSGNVSDITMESTGKTKEEIDNTEVRTNEESEDIPLDEEDDAVKLKDVLELDGNGYYLSELYWLNNRKLVVKLLKNSNNIKENLPENQIYIFDSISEIGKLLYTGDEKDYLMDGNTIVKVNEERFYIYNTSYFLEFYKEELVRQYNLKEMFDECFGENEYVETSLNIFQNGECLLVYDYDIISFNIDNIQDYKILIEKNKNLVSNEKMDEMIKNGIINKYKDIPETYYYLPLFSPDGKYLSYNERETTEGHESQVKIYNSMDKTVESFEFDFMDGYCWSNDGKNIIAYTWPTYAEQPEIRVYNLEKDMYKSYIIGEKIDGITLQSINVQDVFETKLLISCLREGGRPLLQLDFNTGEFKWLTDQNNRIYKAKYSDDGSKIVSYQMNSEGNEIKIITP